MKLFYLIAMDWIALCVICLNIATLQARHEINIKKLIEIIRRRNEMNDYSPILGAPLYPEQLPEAEPILPGHTLIRPALGMLKSAVKFPLRDTGDSLVYGNKANIGLAFDRNWRLRYNNFRKATKEDLLSALLQSIQDGALLNNNNKPLIVKIQKQFPKTTKEYKDLSSLIADSAGDNAREILNNIDPSRHYFEEDSKEFDFRRKRSKSKHRERNYEFSDTSSETDVSSDSSEQEKNPGNPYTIHKNKYKKNWMWNQFMDGDHMNINTYGPVFQNAGPSGAQLFFGRKWWYFNQDDYKPMG